MSDDDAIRKAWRDAAQRVSERKLQAAASWPHSGIGDVAEGPIVGALVSVFDQLADIGAKNESDRRAGL